MPGTKPAVLRCLLIIMINGVVSPSDVAPQSALPLLLATERHIVLNFKDVDIRQVITFISDLTGKTFLVDNTVRGTITLLAPTPLSLDDAYQVFLAMLHSRGFTAIAQGNIIKIVPARKAKSSPIPYRK